MMPHVRNAKTYRTYRIGSPPSRQFQSGRWGNRERRLSTDKLHSSLVGIPKEEGTNSLIGAQRVEKCVHCVWKNEECLDEG